MTIACPQCHANLGYMERIEGYYCINCNSIFVENPDQWQTYDTEYRVFNP